jgi:hypothetical protein
MTSELNALAERLRWAAHAAGFRDLHITAAWQVGSVACFALAFNPRTTLRELKSRQDDLSRLAYAPVTITQDPATGMVFAQLPAPRRQRLIAGAGAPKLSGARIAIGRLISNRGDAIIDFATPAHPHLLIVAATGGGKTEAIHTILYQLARQNRPSQVSFALIDPAGNRIHPAWDNSAHLALPIARADLDAAIRTLEWAAEIVRRRNAGRTNPSPRLLVVVDEMASLFGASREAAERARRALETITQLGRLVNVHAILATQYASRETLGSPFIRANMPARLVGRVDSAQASALATGREGCDAHRLLGYGDFLLIDDAGPRRLQVALSRPDAIASLRRAPSPPPPPPPPKPAEIPLQPPPIELELVEKMRALLAEDPTASNRKLELALFGYTGGAATTTVKRLREQLCAA